MAEKKITAERLYNLSERALNIEYDKFRSWVLKDRIYYFYDDDYEDFEELSDSIEEWIRKEDSGLVRKDERKVGVRDLENTEQRIMEVKDDSKRADWLRMLIDCYVDDDYECLRGLQGSVYIYLVDRRKKE